MYALRQYSLPLALALGLHAMAAWALYSGWHPEKELVNVIRPEAVMARMIVLEPKAKPKPAPPPQAKPQPKPEPVAEQPKPDPDLARRQQAEADRAKQQAAEEAARKAREEQARQERLARLSELAQTSMDQAIEEESADLQAGTEEMVVRSYHAAIYELVRRNWSRPPSSRTGMSARLQVELIPTGEVVAVNVVDSSGNVAFDRSAEHAVRRAKRFEVPEDNALFEKHFRRFYFLFQPEDLLR